MTFKTPWQGCRQHERLAAISRRRFLKAGTLSALGLGLGHYFCLREAQAAVRPARARSVILIYTMGGISHHDSFDPKPVAPPEIRGEFRTIPTKVPSVRFSEEVPLLADAIDKYTLIRSVHHNERDHGVSAYYMLRGYTQPSPELDRPENQNRANPNIGSHVSRLFGSRNGLPPYIVLPGLSYLAQVNYYTAGWMGRAYDPFLLKSDPNQPQFQVRDLARLPDVSSNRSRNEFHCRGQWSTVGHLPTARLPRVWLLTTSVPIKSSAQMRLSGPLIWTSSHLKLVMLTVGHGWDRLAYWRDDSWRRMSLSLRSMMMAGTIIPKSFPD